MPKLTKKQAKAVDNSDSEFPLLDAGLYWLVLNKVVEKKGQQAPYWEWEFSIVTNEDGEDLQSAGRIWENTSLSEKAQWRLKSMFDAFGVPTDTDTEDLIGHGIWANIGQEIQQEGARKGQMVNTFLSAIPAAEDED